MIGDTIKNLLTLLKTCKICYRVHIHSTVKLLKSSRATINFRCALDPAAIGGRHLLEARRLLEALRGEGCYLRIIYIQ